ncbi:MAG: hypothetical protein JO079_06925 [Frankiaceae bacterium]|nr:hypothetical protein [Frankiaceae bacterium]MBV9369272.1 hypothetical protein [Frankiales bacterium]
MTLSRPVLAAGLATLVAVTLTASPASAGTAHRFPGTTCTAFPADNYWHADVSRLAVDARSRAWLAHMSPTRKLHPDFGPSYGAQPVPYGIPVTYVRSSHAKVSVSFTYASESDRVGYPLGTDTKIEGGTNATGDRHAVIVDTGACRLYELWNVRRTSSGRWTAGSGATWLLTSDALRPKGWTSADAAGLAILPGLLRYDEVRAGVIDHAIRFTTNVTSQAYVWPARHAAGSTSDVANYPPMGARFRLKASFPISSSYRADTRVVLTAMKHYGLVLADNGSPWYFQGTQDTAWPSALLDQLKTIPASAFEAVNTAPMELNSSSAKVR